MEPRQRKRDPHVVLVLVRDSDGLVDGHRGRVVVAEVPVEGGDVEDRVLRHLAREAVVRSVEAIVVIFATVAPALFAATARSPPPRLARTLAGGGERDGDEVASRGVMWRCVWWWGDGPFVSGSTF